MDYQALLKERGVILKGHFLLTSGLHSDTYFEKFRLLENPGLLSRLLRDLLNDVNNADWVVGPTLGGALIAEEAARILKCKAAYAEREGNKRVFKRGFHIKKNENIIVVDDVLTTGKSIRETLDLLKGFHISGIFILIDRSGGSVDFDIPLVSLMSFNVKNYTPEECPMCKKGIPLIRKGGSKNI
ncbi:orotate phosphoribosyltransferase [candidate division WOR-3 bacterium]|nr:orotate phosphoribosyltransferase [candidate division WOR-3 bacterium]